MRSQQVSVWHSKYCISLGVIAVAVVCASTRVAESWPFGEPETPGLSVEPPITYLRGADKAILTLTNTGNTALRIDCKTTCNCSRISPAELTLEPEDTKQVKIDVLPGSKGSVISAEALFLDRSSKVLLGKARITAERQPTLVCDAAGATVELKGVGSEGAWRATIRNVSGESFDGTVLTKGPAATFVEVAPKELHLEDGHACELTLKAHYPGVNALSGYITLKSRSMGSNVLSIPLFLAVKRTYLAEPALVTVPFKHNQSEDAPIETIVQVRRMDGAPFRITGAKLTPETDLVAMEVLHAEKTLPVFSIKVSARKRFDAKDYFSGHIILRTDSNDFPEVEPIPIFVLPGKG